MSHTCVIPPTLSGGPQKVTAKRFGLSPYANQGQPAMHVCEDDWKGVPRVKTGEARVKRCGSDVSQIRTVPSALDNRRRPRKCSEACVCPTGPWMGSPTW